MVMNKMLLTLFKTGSGFVLSNKRERIKTGNGKRKEAQIGAFLLSECP